MNAALMAIVLTSAAPVATLQSGTQLVFDGNFVAEKGSPVETEKKFKLALLITNLQESRAGVYWALSEQGRGGWSWIHRFGYYETGRQSDDGGPSLLYERPQGTSEIQLLSPLYFRQKALTASGKWKEGRYDHEVVGTGQVGNTQAWRVDVSNAYGRKRTMLIDQDNPLVVSLKENVFIGQGEKHELKYALVSSVNLDSGQAAENVAAFDGLIALRNRLGIVPGTRDVKWNDERLVTLREQLPGVVAKIPEGPLTDIAIDAARDAKDQKNRAGAVKVMQGKLVGHDSPRPKLFEFNGREFDWKQVDGKVTVLHFWEYRDTPLEEPYGQIAYLDFLFRNRPSDDVKVFGICSHERLLAPDTRLRGILSAKKLKAFMNLSYPILADQTGAIRKFGDPRVTGAKLPLFVVIGKDGKVAHYHVGTYEVNRDRGLEKLDAVVKAAAAKKE